MNVALETLLAGGGFLAVYLLPGYVLSAVFRRLRGSDGTFPGLVLSFTGSLLVLSAVGYLYFIGLLRFREVKFLYLGLAGAGVLLFLARGIRERGWSLTGFLEGVPRGLVITCLAVFAVCLVLAYLKESKVAGDYIFHITGVRKIASSSRFDPNHMWGRFDFPPFPAYRYPLLHFSVALASGIAGQDPIVISNYLPAFLYIVAFCVWYFLAYVLTGDRSFSLGTAACFYLYTGIFQRFATVRFFLVPQHFSDLILFPLLLAVFFLLVKEEGRKAWRLGGILAVLVTSQLAVHGSHWIYFLIISAAYLLLARRFQGRTIRWKPVLFTMSVIFLLAVPVGIGISELARTGTAKDYFEIERDMFLNYRFATAHGAGRIEALGSPDILIVNRSIIFYPYNIPCFLFAIYILARRRFSRLAVFLVAAAASVLLIQLNPLAMRLLAPVISFPGLFRMIVIIPVPLFLAAIAAEFGRGLSRHWNLSRILSGWRILFLLPIIPLYWLVYRNLLMPAYGEHFWKVQWFVMPVVASGLILLLIIRVIRPSAGGGAMEPDRVYSLRANHLWMLLIVFSPLFFLRISKFSAPEYSLRQPHVWRWRNDGWVNYVRDNIKPGSVFIANERLGVFIPVYTDNYAFVGWTPSSPGVERFSWDRRLLRQQVLGDDRGRPGEYLHPERRYQLLAGRGIEYMLISRAETPPGVFSRFERSGFFEKLWDDGRVYIYRVPPLPDPGDDEKSLILEKLRSYYSPVDNPAAIWRIIDPGRKYLPPGLWIESGRSAERILISPAEIPEIEFRFQPTRLPSELRLSVGSERWVVTFNDLSPRRVSLRPPLKPAILRRLCGIPDYNYPISFEVFGEGAVYAQVSVFPPQRTRERPGDGAAGKLRGGRTDPGGDGLVGEAQRVLFDGWFRDRFGADAEEWRKKLGARSLECESAHRKTGAREHDPAASGDLAVVYRAPEHSPGYMVFGQRVSLPRGFWTARFRLRAGEGKGDEPFAVLDVCGDSGRNVLSRVTLRREDLPEDGSYAEISLPFLNGSLHDRLEFRVEAVGKIGIRADRIEVEPDLRSWFIEYFRPVEDGD